MEIYYFAYVVLLNMKTATALFSTLQSRGKGKKNKRKYKPSTGGSLSDSSGSVIRQVGVVVNLLPSSSSHFYPRMLVFRPSYTLSVQSSPVQETVFRRLYAMGLI